MPLVRDGDNATLRYALRKIPPAVDHGGATSTIGSSESMEVT